MRLSASWQAVTRVNTEAAPKVTMRRPTLPGLGEGWYGSNDVLGRQVLIRFAGVVGDSMSTRSKEQGAPREARLGGSIGGANRGFWRLAQAGRGGARTTDEAG